MTIKASGRSALVLAAGLFVCFAGPSQAAEGGDSETPTVSKQASKATGAPMVLKKYAKSHHWKKYTQHKSSKAALNSANDKKPATTDVAADDGNSSTAIPPWVANAHAQLASADTPTGNAKAMSARANDILQTTQDNSTNTQPATDTQVVSADQLNDVDRALHDSTPPAPTKAMAFAEAPAAPVMASSNESSTWDQTSLIGKIFIGFGALLTMASAARMFMA
jgi:hypothetical protein